MDQHREGETGAQYYNETEKDQNEWKEHNQKIKKPEALLLHR